MNRRFPLRLALSGATCLALLLALPVDRVRAQSAPPLDPAAVLAALKDLKSKQPGIVSKEKAGVNAALSAAAAEPGKAYEQAAMAVEIQGGGGNEGARTVEWRKRNAALLRDPDFLEAVRLHLLYLGLTWQHSNGAKPKDQLAALLEYAGRAGRTNRLLVPAEPNRKLPNEVQAAYEMVKRSVGDGLFTNYFQIGPYLSKGADWEDRPFNVEGIFQKTILPEMRAEKDPRVLAYWNDRIQAETVSASASNNALAVNKCNNVTRPALFWSRAEDEYAIGQVNQAVADMMAQLKAHPDHPDFDKWVGRVTEIVNPPKGEVTVGPATEAGSAGTPGAVPTGKP